MMSDTSAIYHYRATSLQPVTDKVLLLRMSPESMALSYQAGQYIELVNEQGEGRFYSIANAPFGLPEIELHIRHRAGDEFIDNLLTQIKSGRALKIKGPFGRCVLTEKQPPMIFIAGGTGFAPHKAILEQLFAVGLSCPVHLFWGASQVGDFYLEEIPLAWEQHIDGFSYTPVLRNACEKWQGKTGFLNTAVTKAYPELCGYCVYVAGPPELVAACRDSLLAKGLKPENFYAD